MFKKVLVRSWSIFVLCGLGAIVLVAGSDTYGDDGGVRASPIDEKSAPEYPNLDSQLRAQLEAFEAGTYPDDGTVGAPGDGLLTEPPLVPEDWTLAGTMDPRDGLPQVDVTIYVTRDVDAVVRFLTSNGALVRNIGSAYLEASVPVALLGETSQLPGVTRVEPAIGPLLDASTDPNPPATKDAAPQIPEKSPQRFANLTSDLDDIAKDVDAGVFSVDSLSVDSLAERALLHEQPAADDGQSTGNEDASVGVTIYALEDIGAAAGFLKQNGVAIRNQGDTYLEAYVPVGLLGQASLQPDVIRIEPIVGPYLEQTTDPCIVDLGTLTLPSSRSASGSWTGECDSENRAGRYARYYSFELPSDSIVTIDLTSSDADTHLYLMREVGKSGDIVALDDDGGNGLNARIVHTLQWGNYTIEATTSSRETGSFALEVDITQFDWCWTPQNEISGTRKLQLYGPWRSVCESGNRAGKYAQYYPFTLAESTSVTISMNSTDVGTTPYAYLIDGQFWYDNVIGGGDPARVSHQYHLRPGSYLIEATTFVTSTPDGTRLEVRTSPATIVTSEGASLHGAPAWNDVGITGDGVKVGIIDGGFTDYDRFGSELPSLDGFKCYLPPESVVLGDPRDCAGNSSHGTAVAESLVDIAPDASIYIANPRTPGDLHDAVDWMISQGVEVINHSVSWTFDGPGDGTSPRENSPLRGVDRAVEGGITWVNAAGNSHRGTWLGGYSDADGNGQIEFQGTDDVMGLTTGSGDLNLQLRWDDSWVGADTDLDLFVIGPQDRVVARSEDFQTGLAGHVPSEIISELPIAGSGYRVIVRHASGKAPEWIQLIVRGAILEHYTQGSITSPGESANPGMLAVGAAPWSDVETIETTSAQGPTTDGRVKPDIVGADGGLSRTYNGRFFGTSQSSPHVAGMAALVRQQYPDFRAADVARYLRNQSILRPESDGATLVAPNNVWGYGFAYLPPPPLIPMGYLLASTVTDSGDQYGISSATSADGSTIVIGSLSDGTAGEQSGAAYVFTETMVDYAQNGKLTASDGAAGDYLGSSVSISGDGSTIAVGAPGDGSGAGSVYVFTVPSGGWASAAGTIKLTASDGAAGDGFGSSVSISGDGSTIIVGAHSNDVGAAADAGAAYVFTRPATGWATSSAGVKLTAADGMAADEFGTSVSASQDGGTIAIGASGDSPGSVYVFTVPSGGWVATSTTIKLTGPSHVDARAQLGGSVSISGDGSTIVAGSPEAPGAAYVFAMPASGWMATSTSARLTAPGGDARDRFGWSVSTNSDGSSIAVGAPDTDSGGRFDRMDDGAVYMFTKPTDGWAATSTAAKLERFSPASGQNFGYSASLSSDGGTVVVTAPNHFSGGSVNQLKLPTGGWVDVESNPSSFLHITGDLQAGNGFGQSVSVSADEGTVVVGASNDDSTARDAGAIYVFTRPTGGWEASTPTPVRLLASDGAAGDGFGQSVSVSSDGGVIAVGANGDADNGSNSGSVYVFIRPSGGWSTSATSVKLTASDGASGDQFGGSVSLSGDGNTLVVGAARDNGGGGVNSGSAYAFTKPTAGWATSAAQAKLTVSDGAANDQFGGSVSISADGGVIVIGAIGTPFLGRTSDAAYVFTRPTAGWATSNSPVKLTPSDGGAANAQFGGSVSVSGDGNTIVVGALAANGAVDDTGAAYVFTKPATGWAAASTTVKLTMADGADRDSFGASVSTNADGGRIVIGANRDNNDANESGAVYQFTKPSTGWAATTAATTTATRLPVEHASGVNRYVGGAVSVGGTVTTVGASASADQPGNVYLYRPLNAPVKVGTVTNQSMTEGGSAVMVDVSSNFRDPDGGTLTYTVASSNSSAAAVAVSTAGVVTITPAGPGSATISVTVTNPNNLTATQSFTTTVTGTPALVRDLNARAYDSTTIIVFWTVPQNHGRAITRFELQRKAGTGSYSTVTPAPTLGTNVGGGITYQDTGLTEGTTYTYRVRAYDSVGVRGWSNEFAATPNGDRDALIGFYDDMDGANWTINTNWKSNAHHERWWGVTTDFAGRVLRLRLGNNGLQGAISTQLENLPKLQGLYIGGNSFTGGIPTELGNLENLRHLQITISGLSGTIPPQLGNLPNLLFLDLSRNDTLTGGIPWQLGNLSKLESLSLHNNDLSGSIPSQLGNLSNLESLSIMNNSLSGSIPSELGNLSKLDVLHLFNNDLSGQIPTQFGNLSNLNQLWLHHNSLSGSIPSELGNLSKVWELDLSYNSLSGSIPSELGNLSNLQRLYLHENDLSGAIPSQLGNLSNLQLLDLQDNDLSGSIPSELGNLSNLDSLLLFGNDLSGSIPAELGKLSKLRLLYLHSNQLSGPIPSQLGDLSKLQGVRLYNNRLTGSIPSELGNLSDVSSLFLHNNRLTGSIPAELGNLPRVAHLWLNDNQLTGSIPAELGNLPRLFYLYLHNNDLSGSIPSELGNLSNLRQLAAFNNSLSGPIPAQLGGLSTVELLYLYDNSLSGPIPAGLGDLSNLQRLHLYDNELSGPIPAELGNLSNLWDLQLYDNMLTGIPAGLGSLSNLSQMWLYNNRLSGSIPADLGNLSNLSQLRLHNNQLSGSIPSQLGNLSSLSQMWLHNNQLSGSIPSQLGDLSRVSQLWLNNNELTGQIPSELGDLSNLVYLRLNDNRLSGQIPSALTSLTSLLEFYFDENTGGLCAPRDADFQAWLMGVSNARGPTCAPPPTPTPTATSTPMVIPTPRATTTPMVIPTPTATTTPMVIPTATTTPMVMPTPTATSTPMVVPTPTATTSPIPTPTPTRPTGGGGGIGVATPVPIATPIPTPSGSEIITSTDALAFTAVQGGDNPPAQMVSVWNAARLVDMPFTVSSNSNWLSFSPSSASSNSPFARVRVQVSVDASGLKAGTYSGAIVISASGASNSPRSIAVSLTITAPATAQTPGPGTTDEDMTIATSDASARLEVPAGVAPSNVEIRITKLDVGPFVSPPGSQERSVAAVDVQTFVDGTPTPMTYPQGMDLWFALPDGEEAACAAGRVRVYQVDGAEWTLLEHRCETDDGGGVWAVTTLTHFSTYVMVIDDAPATPTPVPTATPTSTPTAQEMMTPSPIPPGELPETGGATVSGGLLLLLFLAGGLLVAAGSTILRTRPPREAP